jgi:chromate reductase
MLPSATLGDGAGGQGGRQMKTYKIGYFVGSLATNSINRKLAKALVALAPPELEMSEIGFADLPLYSYDYDADYPPVARAFKDAIAAVDGVLFVTPEYNRSIPRVLKNAIDVASRPYGKSSFLGKPVGIVGNSPGALGAVSAVKHLQNILPGIAGPILGQPEIYLNGVGAAFDDKGQLTNEAVQKVLQQYIDAFAAFIEKQNG